MTKERQICSTLIFQYFSTEGCIEPFQVEDIDFEGALVKEVLITDRNKNNEIKVSKTFTLDTMRIYVELSAKVKDAYGNFYEINEKKDADYVSKSPYVLRLGTSFSLYKNTANGSKYGLDMVSISQPSKIDRLYTERDFKDHGVNEDMSIYVYSYNQTVTNIDFFKGERLPSFIIECPVISNINSMAIGIENDEIRYWDDNNV